MTGNGSDVRSVANRRALFELRGVRKSFDGHLVLREIDLRIERGSTVGIIGPSGSGKTVLLKCMVGLVQIDGGELYFDGESVPAMSQLEQTLLRRRVGLLFQQGGLFDSMTVEENLEYGLREQLFSTMEVEAMRARAAWALDAVGLSRSEATALPSALSGGMQKRVGIARTIVTRPDVVLYDEPTQGLDPPNAHLISNLIADLREKLGITSLIVSHDLRTIFTLCDRVGFLNEGRIVEVAPPASLAQSRNTFVRDFVTGHPPEEPFDPRESKPPEPWR